MIKKKKKQKTAAKKTAKKKSSGKRGRGGKRGKRAKELHPAEVRKDIALLVEEEAANMAKAVIGVGKTGQLAPVKFLLELAHIFPQSTDGSQGTPEDDSLAKTLFNKLNIPDTPIQHDENGDLVTPPSKPAQEQLIAGGEKDSGVDAGTKSDGGDKDSVLV